MSNSIQLTLIGRSYCHLCDDLRAALVAAAQADGVVIELSEIDVDERPELEEEYGMLVPVLLRGGLPDGVEICHYHFDPSAWRSAIAA
ncbi:MAG: glutaredoxin family protein [Burkholderiales bacterium]